MAHVDQKDAKDPVLPQMGPTHARKQQHKSESDEGYIRGMNKYQRGFKGNKALTRLMGNIKGKRLIKAFGRKRALNSK